MWPHCGPGGLRSLVADAFGAPVLRDQGPDRPAGHGKDDAGVEQTSRLLVGLVVDLSVGGVALDRLDAVDCARLLS